MKKLIEYFYYEVKVQLRVPINLFFSIFFPLILYYLFVSLSKNPVIYGTVTFASIYLPLMMLLSMLSSGIITFSIITAGNNSDRLWLEYMMRGFKLYQLVIVQIIVNILVCLFSSIILVIFAKVMFNVEVPSFTNLIRFFLVWIVVAVAIHLVGFVLGLLSRDEKFAQTISVPLMFILMILSGIMINFKDLPLTAQKISNFLPSTQANKILVYFWNIESGFTFDGSFIILFAWMIITSVFIVYKLNKINIDR